MLENQDILDGLPPTLPNAHIPCISSRVIKELTLLDKISTVEEIDAELVDKNIEQILLSRIEIGDEQAHFQLGQIQLENKYYCSAWKTFQVAWHQYNDLRAKYQIGMMLYDGWVDEEVLKQYENPQSEACKIFEEIVRAPHGPADPVGQAGLAFYAAYNIARAYYHGYGYPADEIKAIEYFKIAANEGERNGCLLAQTSLGYIYSSPEHRDLKQALYWHSEACGNGSVESQACIGVMYLYGLGVKQDWAAALFCLSEASERGSIYATASLVYLYYKRKMFTNAAVLANRIIYRDWIDYDCESPVCIKRFVDRSKAMACFIYARCLQLGLGVKEDTELAAKFYSKSVKYDSQLASRYQKMAQIDQL